MLKYDEGVLRQYYDRIVLAFEKRLANSKCREGLNERVRVLRKMAVFALTALLVNKADIGIRFDVKKIISRFFDLEESSYRNRGDIAEEAFEHLKSKIMENSSRLYVEKTHSKENNISNYFGSCIGKTIRDKDGNLEHIWLTTAAVKAFLNDDRYRNNFSNIFDSWIKSGKLLKTEKGRKDCKRMILGMNLRVQILYVGNSDFSVKLEEATMQLAL